MSIESPKIPAVVTVRYVVMSVLNRLQDYSMKQYLRLTQIAIEGFSEDRRLLRGICVVSHGCRKRNCVLTHVIGKDMRFAWGLC